MGAWQNQRQGHGQGQGARSGERCETNPRVNLISDRLNRINFHLTHESKTG